MNEALLLLRLVLGLILLCHAMQKSLGWLQGPGLSASAEIFERLGHTPGRAKVIIAATCETVSGLLLIAGVLTPLAAAIALGTLTVAAMSMCLKAHAFWTTLGGGEYPTVLAFMASVIALAGPGAHSVDGALAIDYPKQSTWGALLVAAAVAIPPILAASRQGRRERTTPQ